MSRVNVMDLSSPAVSKLLASVCFVLSAFSLVGPQGILISNVPSTPCAAFGVAATVSAQVGERKFTLSCVRADTSVIPSGVNL